jgi:hypothetical protein
MPNTRQVGSQRGVFPAQGAVALFPEKRMTRHSPADWMMRRLVGEATPELEHLRVGKAQWRTTRQPH